MKVESTVSVRCDLASKTLGVGFINRRSIMPVHISVPNDAMTFNTLIGAAYGEVVSVKVKNRSLRLWVDDVGAIRRDRELNKTATALSGQPIYGDAILMAKEDEAGELRDLTLDDILAVSDAVAETIDRLLNGSPSEEQR